MTPTAAGTPFTRTSRLDRLGGLLAERILVLDGAMGTMLQRYQLTEADYRGVRFRDHHRDVRNNPDLLNLTRPDVVAAVHAAYLEAGADIIETNTFTATSLSQADYDLAPYAAEMSREGARIARLAAKRPGITPAP